MKEAIATYRNHIGLFLLMGSLCVGCTEPFSPDLLPQTESILVVDVTLTNELKNHEVLLSRSSTEAGELQIESNATVTVLDDIQQTFVFTESEPGTYVSDIAFAAEFDRTYRLLITTADGRSYTSSTESLPQTAQIENVEAKKKTTDSGNEGIVITVDSFDPTGNSIFYRYEYEETYKIVAPKWGPSELVASPEEFRTVGLVDRDPNKEERTCYATAPSNSIILTKTSGVGEDRVSDFEVRFLNKDNYIISHRYSILVKQYVLSRQAYGFYEKLKDFSGSESLFSESQPGFINGNIFPDDGSNERVVGIFDVSSISEKRIFFNYVDFFPDEELPPFIDECRRTTVARDDPAIYEAVRSNRVSYVGNITNQATGALEAYIVVPRVCGDCTVLGNATIPDFWEE